MSDVGFMYSSTEHYLYAARRAMCDWCMHARASRNKIECCWHNLSGVDHTIGYWDIIGICCCRHDAANV